MHLCTHGRSKQSGWTGFGWTSFYGYFMKLRMCSLMNNEFHDWGCSVFPVIFLTCAYTPVLFLQFPGGHSNWQYHPFHSTGCFISEKSAPLGLASGNDYTTWLSARLKAVISFN